MAAAKSFRLRLTDEQRQALKQALGREVAVLEFPDVTALEPFERGAAQPMPRPDPPITLSREEHLHGLWVVLGLDEV